MDVLCFIHRQDLWLCYVEKNNSRSPHKNCYFSVWVDEWEIWACFEIYYSIMRAACCVDNSFNFNETNYAVMYFRNFWYFLVVGYWFFSFQKSRLKQHSTSINSSLIISTIFLLLKIFFSISKQIRLNHP